MSSSLYSTPRKMMVENISFIEQYPFHVVQFVTRGKQPSQRPIDIVCTSWMRHEEKKNKIFVKYPPPPYDEDHAAIYEDHLKLKLDPMENWTEFHVKIKGRACNYESALEKCEELKSSITALTMESDVSVETVERRAADQIKQFQLKQKAASLKKSISSKDYFQLTASTSKKQPVSVSHAQSLVNSHNMDIFNEDFQVSTIESSTVKPHSKNTTKIPEKTTPRNPTGKSINKNGANSSKNLSKLWSKIPERGSSDTIKSDDNLPTVQITSSLVGIMDLLQDSFAEIKGLKKSVNALTEEVRLIRINGGNGKNFGGQSFIGTISQLNDKYKYELPCIYMDEFKNFEMDLSTNEELCADVKNILLTAVDSSLVISKSIVKMLKLFLERDVAIHYTAIKATPKKEAIKSTQLFKLIDAVIKERRSMAHLETLEDNVHTALSSVMSNVPSWKLTSARGIEKNNLKVHRSAKTSAMEEGKNLNHSSTNNQAVEQNNNELNDQISLSGNSEDGHVSEDKDDSQSSEEDMDNEFTQSFYVQIP